MANQVDKENKANDQQVAGLILVCGGRPQSVQHDPAMSLGNYHCISQPTLSAIIAHSRSIVDESWLSLVSLFAI